MVADETNHFGIATFSSAAGANSGYYLLSFVTTTVPQLGLTWESLSKSINTNAGVRSSFGFLDATTAANPTDGMRLLRSNNIVIGQVWNNSILSQTAEAVISSNQWLKIKIQVTATNQVDFKVWDGDTGSSILSETVTASLPSGSSRAFGIGIHAYYTNAAISVLDYVDKIRVSVNKPMSR